MIDAKVVGLDQSVSFEDGSITNFMLLKLGTGQILRCIITDDSARLLVSLAQGVEPPPATQTTPVHPPAPPRPPVPTVQAPAPAAPPTNFSESEGGVLFGGDYDPASLEEDAPWLPSGPEPQMADPLPAVPLAADPMAAEREYKEREKAKKNRPPAAVRTVQKDEMGYPISQGRGVDPRAITGGAPAADADEDGVRQM